MLTNREKAAGNIPLDNFDPRYIQIDKWQASAILGMPFTSFDRARKEDDRFPTPIVQGTSKNAPLRFILAEIYEYSAQLIADSREKRGAA